MGYLGEIETEEWVERVEPAEAPVQEPSPEVVPAQTPAEPVPV